MKYAWASERERDELFLLLPENVSCIFHADSSIFLCNENEISSLWNQSAEINQIQHENFVAAWERERLLKESPPPLLIDIAFMLTCASWWQQRLTNDHCLRSLCGLNIRLAAKFPFSWIKLCAETSSFANSWEQTSSLSLSFKSNELSSGFSLQFVKFSSRSMALQRDFKEQ